MFLQNTHNKHKNEIKSNLKSKEKNYHIFVKKNEQVL